MLLLENLPTLIETVLLVVAVVGGAWWRIHGRISGLENELAAYKLEVAKEYVSTAHLNEVERRIVDSMDKLSEDIKGLEKFLRSRPKTE